MNQTAMEQATPVELELVDPVFPAPSGSVFTSNWFDASADGIPIKLAKSVRPLPALVLSRQKELVSYVGGEHYGGAYAFVHSAQARALAHSRLTAHYKRAFLDGGYLYLVNPTFETGEADVTLRGLF